MAAEIEVSTEAIEEAIADLDRILNSIRDSEDLGSFNILDVHMNPNSTSNAGVKNEGPEERDVVAAESRETDSTKHIRDRKTGHSGSTSLTSKGTSYNKKESKITGATEPTYENTSSGSKEGKRGPYKCSECGKPMKEKDRNGHPIPHRCPRLFERVESWKRSYRNRIPSQRLNAILEEAERRRMHGNDSAQQPERRNATKPTSYSSKWTPETCTRTEGGYRWILWSAPKGRTRLPILQIMQKPQRWSRLPL
jgi:hypothetical protein